MSPAAGQVPPALLGGPPEAARRCCELRRVRSVCVFSLESTAHLVLIETAPSRAGLVRSLTASQQALFRNTLTTGQGGVHICMRRGPGALDPAALDRSSVKEVPSAPVVYSSFVPTVQAPPGRAGCWKSRLAMHMEPAGPGSRLPPRQNATYLG